MISTKPAKLGTIWTAQAKIKFIEDSLPTPKWVTVAVCMDTPNAIKKALAEAQSKNPSKTLWVFSDSHVEDR